MNAKFEEFVIAVANMLNKQKKAKRRKATDSDQMMMRADDKMVDGLIKDFYYKQMDIQYEKA